MPKKSENKEGGKVRELDGNQRRRRQEALAQDDEISYLLMLEEEHDKKCKGCKECICR